MGSKVVIFTAHVAIKHLLTKVDSKSRMIIWVLLIQEFDIVIKDKKRSENVVANHLSRLKNKEVSFHDALNDLCHFFKEVMSSNYEMTYLFLLMNFKMHSMTCIKNLLNFSN